MADNRKVGDIIYDNYGNTARYHHIARFGKITFPLKFCHFPVITGLHFYKNHSQNYLLFLRSGLIIQPNALIVCRMIHHFLFTLSLICSLFISTFSPAALHAETRGVSPLFHGYVTKEPINFLMVEKQTQTLMLYEQNSTLKLLKTFACATGENPGNKLQSGDSRTPEGIYFITEIYEDNKITVFGSRAFHLDYPNIFDTHAGRRGNGIFIHGTNKKLIPFSSNGCITLDNRDLDQLAPYLTINQIPIIIVDSLTSPLNIDTPNMKPGSLIFNSILRELRFAPESMPAENIESLYFLEAGSQAVALVKYTLFDDNSAQYSYHKKAYFTKGEATSWRSVYAMEGQDTIPYLLARKVTKNGEPSEGEVAEPEVAKVREPNVARIDETSVVKTPPPARKPPARPDLRSFLEQWRQAWSGKDLEAYMACYSPSFTSGKLDFGKWRARKQALNQKYSYINVTIRDVSVEQTTSGARVSFYQTYQSDKYQTSGRKHLQLVLIDDQWRIQNEYM